MQSGYEHIMKQMWLGPYYYLPGKAGNKVDKTNVPDIRESFRHETHSQEVAMVNRYANYASSVPGGPGSSLSQPTSPRRDKFRSGDPLRSAHSVQPSPSMRGQEGEPKFFSRLDSHEASSRDNLANRDRNESGTSLNRPYSGYMASQVQSPDSVDTMATPQAKDTWTDGSAYSSSGPEPRIFPGMVHERNRRGTMRRETPSSQEADSDGGDETPRVEGTYNFRLAD